MHSLIPRTHSLTHSLTEPSPCLPPTSSAQVEGAFTQGFGLFTMEEMIWGDNEVKRVLLFAHAYMCMVVVFALDRDIQHVNRDT